ncbi:Crp/Fnr family transcriptional regulator [Leptospira wolffii]|uniref:Crp/Fnr family transcriptional regulator n=1 Tax=Leptospira wolffii TaxID=409998 RepID=A0ABV5BMS5_9LEPT|nr:Crp/Fnr family transcriptional regulator [Leptospira wolffii]TGL55435.1 Crp/Fnr family transcriptional regulator [Leptospira wolffii]
MMTATQLTPEYTDQALLNPKFDTYRVSNLDLKIRLTRREISKNGILFSEGDTAHGFYIVESGSFRSFRSSASAGKQQTFQFYGPGNWMGIRDAVYGGKYLHHAIALEDSSVFFIEEDELKRLLQSDSEFQNSVFYQVAKDSVEAENKIYSLGTRQVHAKLSEFLLQFMDGQSGEVDLPFTREVMASVIGVTTETLVRALTDLKSRNWIDIDKRKIFVKDELALRRLLD